MQVLFMHGERDKPHGYLPGVEKISSESEQVTPKGFFCINLAYHMFVGISFPSSYFKM